MIENCLKISLIGILGIVSFVLMVACRAETEAPAATEPSSQASTLLETDNRPGWSTFDLAMIRSLWLGSLPPLPPDPSNGVADDPQAVALGHQLFFDTRLSANGQVSCATCHQPERLFTDGLPLAQAIGTTLRSTPTLVGLGYSDWFYWDGRRDSQWSQALTPLEAAVEHGATRNQLVHLLQTDEAYRAAYEAIFGPLPDLSDASRFPAKASPLGDQEAQSAWYAMRLADREIINQIYANMGKALAAYQRRIIPGPSRFDRYVEAILTADLATAETELTPDEIAGLRIFIGQGQCIRCHNGPLFTSGDFHNINVPTGDGLPLDYGRIQGVQQVFEDPFNCIGQFSDADPDQCLELNFVKTSGEELPGAFKVPTLRNIAETAPYMHAGQFATLPEVIAHYNAAQPGPLGHNELNPLGLSQTQLGQLVSFLQTLSGPLATEPDLLAPPSER